MGRYAHEVECLFLSRVQEGRRLSRLAGWDQGSLLAFTASEILRFEILRFEILRFYRGDFTGVIRGTIFVQLYKTRHEQVSFKEQNKNSTTGPYFRRTQIGSKKGVWSCNILHHHGQTTDSSYIEYPRWL